MISKEELGYWETISARMQELLASEPWDAFYKCLSDREIEEMERLVGCQALEHDYRAGFIQGLRCAFRLPQEIIDRVVKMRQSP